MLGFDPGRIDGIFGQQTGSAVQEFQRNVGLPQDGIVGSDTIRELRRLRTPGHNPDHVVTGIKELERFRLRAAATLLVAIASTGARDAFADLLALHLGRRGARTLILDGASDSEQAYLANRAGADLLLALRPAPDVDGIRILFYSGYRYESPVGRTLAARVADRLRATSRSMPLETGGLALPLLRETAMPALLVEVGPATDAAALAALAAPELAALADKTAML